MSPIKQLEACITALSKTVPFKAKLYPADSGLSNVDCSLMLNDDLTLPVYWLNNPELGQELIGKGLTECDKNLIFAAPYIQTRLATYLRESGIQYMDAAGNAFVNSNNYHVVIVGQRPSGKAFVSTMVKSKAIGDDEKTGKAFQPAGLKVIFSLLSNPALANSSLRTIVNQSGVSLGSVSAIHKDLLAHGYLQKVNNTIELKDRGQLIMRWAEAFPYLVRNKTQLGQFTSDDMDWWRAVDEKVGVQLSGEVAASLLSNYLQPKDGIVYATKETLRDLMKAARLRRLKEGEQPTFIIDVYEPFWPMEPGKLTAPKLIVYSDLLSNNDPRNEDAARRIFDEYLA